MKQNPSQPNPPDVWRTKYQDPILQKSTKADFTSDKMCNLPPSSTPAVLLRLLPRLASRDAEASKSEAVGADAVYWTIKKRRKKWKWYIKKSISHFDRSPDLSGRSGEIYSKTELVPSRVEGFLDSPTARSK
jgi:hypothetical protein